MENLPETQSQPDLIQELRQCANLLTEKLQSDQYEEASKLIENLTDFRDQHIFQSIGKLTRGLHNSIVNFNVDGGESDQSVNDGEFNDASNRLNYVIELTKTAAEKTMDMVEESAPISTELAQESAALKEEWSKLSRREMTAEEFRTLYHRLDLFFENTNKKSDQLNENLQNIILEQGFQDLTGQVLRRVMSLIEDVEENLVSLVKIAGQVESVIGIDTETVRDQNETKEKDIKGEGPQIKADERNDVVSSQDEVDDLLSSLGF